MSTITEVTRRERLTHDHKLAVSYVLALDCGHETNLASLHSPQVGTSYVCFSCLERERDEEPDNESWCPGCGQHPGVPHLKACPKWIEQVSEEQTVKRSQPSTLDFPALRAANVRRCEESFHAIDAWDAERWGLATIGEAGEVLEAVLAFLARATLMGNSLKKLIRGDGDAQAVGREVADTIIYGDLLLARLGLDTGECVRETFNAKSNEIGSGVKL